jgi:pimeloyl-ACP methyl ester carboxylesterase
MADGRSTAAASTGTGWDRLRRPVTKWLAILAGFLVLFHLAGGWYFSGELYSSGLEPDPATPDYTIAVSATGLNTITLSTADGPDELRVPGVWGLQWPSGYGQLRRLAVETDDTVEWELQVTAGSGPAVGDLADFDVRAYPGDPLASFGIAFEDVTYPSELGDNPAWLIDGDDPTWVILVHGNGMTRRDVLKPLPLLAQAGYPALAITYRNHPLAPADPSGRLQYGLTEWRDVEGAVQYALDNGADDVVLVGYSMGGGIVVNFLYESGLANRVAGIVLDSPMLDFGAAVDLGAENRSLPVVGLPIPGTLTATAKWLAGARYDVDWGRLDYLDRVDEIDVPILLFHGVADDTVPVETSDEMARLRPDIVTYVRVENAPHIGSWNLGPARYEEAVRTFLAGLREEFS